jgi:hypothetical protein
MDGGEQAWRQGVWKKAALLPRKSEVGMIMNKTAAAATVE